MVNLEIFHEIYKKATLRLDSLELLPEGGFFLETHEKVVTH